jgi:hypothetical protein
VVKIKFAIIPIKIGKQWIWLEKYRLIETFYACKGFKFCWRILCETMDKKQRVCMSPKSKAFGCTVILILLVIGLFYGMANYMNTMFLIGAIIFGIAMTIFAGYVIYWIYEALLDFFN